MISFFGPLMSVPTVKSPFPSQERKAHFLSWAGQGGEHQVGLGWPFPLSLSRSREMQLELPIVNKGTKFITNEIKN